MYVEENNGRYYIVTRAFRYFIPLTLNVSQSNVSCKKNIASCRQIKLPFIRARLEMPLHHRSIITSIKRLRCVFQYGGESGRRLASHEKPLEIQDQFLQKLGYQDVSRRSRLGVDPELRHLIAFHVGEYNLFDS